MKQNILRALGFCLIFAVLFLGFTQLLIPKNNSPEAGIHDDWAKGFLAEPENTVDVLVLGDSEVYSCLVPLVIWEEQGITTYTCGTSDQKLYQTESYLHRFFRTQSPALVILETNILYRDYSTTDIIPHLFEEGLPLVRYHDRWKDLTPEDLTRKVSFTHIQRDKGYIHLEEILGADDRDYMTYTDALDPIPGKSLRHVQNILAFCREQGAQLVLLSSPSTANWDYSRHNAVEQLARELEIPYIDTNLMPQEIPIDWQLDTRDGGDHLNYTGAEKLSRWLGGYLAETGLFRDKRIQEAYAPWNEALADFRSAVSNNE